MHLHLCEETDGRIERIFSDNQQQATDAADGACVACIQPGIFL